MPEQVAAPIFVQYKDGRVVAFDEVFEAEMMPVEHFERIECVLDSFGRELRFMVKQQLAARLEITNAPDESRLRDALIQALQEIGDIDVERASREELVARALESFRLRKDTSVEWGTADWSGAFIELLGRIIFDR